MMKMNGEKFCAQPMPKSKQGSLHVGLRILSRALLAAVVAAAFAPHSRAQVNVTTFHNDIGRTGQNLNETKLTTANVNSTQFGKLFSQTVDGQIYAQPLYVANVSIGGATHNVIYVATEHDSIYAFDADSNGGIDASPLWQVSMLSIAHGAAAGAATVPSSELSADIQPEVGITGTPVIDTTGGTLYVVSKAIENGSAVQRLHALDITSGSEKFGGPVVITATVTGTGNGSSGGNLTFDSMWENQRPGLLLLNGIVYVGFAAHGDNGPWHGWIFGYNAKTLAQTGVFNSSPNGVGSGFWMSGDGLAADVADSGHPYGRMFVATGNGDYTAAQPYSNNMDFGDSDLRLDLTNGVPTIQDEFTPYNQASLDSSDGDLGSGGTMVVPEQSTGSYPHLLVQSGKQGSIYLINRDNMGGYNGTNNNLQTLNATLGAGVWSTPAYWNGNVYYWANSDSLKSFSLNNGVLSTTPTKSNETNAFPGATPSISANGNTEGIVWTLDTETYNSGGQAILMAHNASNVATTLYNSSTNASRDSPGPSVKFAVPTISNGKVYVGTSTQLSVYGILGGSSQAATPILSPGTGSFSGNIAVAITDTTPSSTIYYTVDGSTPSAASNVYSGPINVSITETVKAVASATGFLLSPVASATYTDTSQTLVPALSLVSGTYTGSPALTITDASPNAAIYYTTDGTTPTTASTQYTGPITLSTALTLNAIAVAPGLIPSGVATGVYTIIGSNYFDFGQGFASSQSYVVLKGSSKLDDSRLQLTDGISYEQSAAWYYTPVNVRAFNTSFSFQLSNPAADGMTFAIQGNGTTSIGANGAGLGYQGIGKSVAIKFDLFSNSGEGIDSTGLYQNGASPTTPAIDLSSSGIDLHSDDTMLINLSYDGTILSMTITDSVTKATYSTNWTVNIPSLVGANTAYIGFTGSTGGMTASQKLLTWNYKAMQSQSTAATPTFNPAGGTFTTSQSVTLSDSTTGTTIYYTTDGSAPTTSSTKYAGAITVSSTETIKAIAAATNFATSAVGSATYTISPVLATPVFTPVGGSYSTSQSVTVTDANAAASIHYTIDGSAPNATSTKYVGAITVATSETVKAIAIASGYTNSAVASASYVITSGGSTGQNYINFSTGFTNTGLIYNGGTAVAGNLLQLTDGHGWEDRSVWYSTAVPIQNFVTDFNFQLINPVADGFTFTVQNIGTAALGSVGGGLGYQGITKSIAVKFDLFSNTGEGADSVGFYTIGNNPTTPAIDLSSTGINLHSGDVFHAHLGYDGVTLTLTLTDNTTNATVTEQYVVNIPNIVGSTTAFVGFTSGTGGSSATQNILNWTYTTGLGTASTPTFSPAGGTYTTNQSVTLADATAGASIYYTINGSAPTASSTKYTGAIAVTSAETIKAIAAAANYANSAVASAAYTINPVLPTTVISPAGGTYTAAQSVTISDSTAAASIYYTTDGSTPTTSSAKYSGAITVGSSQTIKAIAAASGYTNSATAAVSYVINIGGSTGKTYISFVSGFTNTGLTYNGGAAVTGTLLQLTDNHGWEARSAWFSSAVPVQSFVTDFNFQLLNPSGDGFTFTIQGQGTAAVGSVGSGLGYQGMTQSVGIKFDLYNNAGEGADSVGFYTNGASPTVPALDLTPTGIDLHSGAVFHAHLAYDGTTLTLTITDNTTNAAVTKQVAVNIPSIVGSSTAYVGFTGGTGGSSATQNILSWTYASN